jgi:hypothetical protein
MVDERQASPTRGWAVLRAGDKEPSGLSIPTKSVGINAPAGAIRIALGDKGEARLLLPLADNEDPSRIIGAPALSVSVTQLKEHLKTHRFLDLICSVNKLEVVFAEVVDQIIGRIRGGVSCSDAVHSTIDEFRALLTSKVPSDAPREKVAGLLGELLLLDDLLHRSPEGWRAWRGPEGARHDFVMGITAFEVKVSMKKGSSIITVNGLEQLCEPAGGNLFLQHYELEAASNGPISIRTLGEKVLQRASDPPRVVALLAAAGCPSVDDDAWNAVSFRLEGDRVYRVNDGFPRIISSSFADTKAPVGVSTLSYCVDLSVSSSKLLKFSDASAAKEALIA